MKRYINLILIIFLFSAMTACNNKKTDDIKKKDPENTEKIDIVREIALGNNSVLKELDLKLSQTEITQLEKSLEICIDKLDKDTFIKVISKLKDIDKNRYYKKINDRKKFIVTEVLDRNGVHVVENGMILEYNISVIKDFQNNRPFNEKELDMLYLRFGFNREKVSELTRLSLEHFDILENMRKYLDTI